MVIRDLVEFSTLLSANTPFLIDGAHRPSSDSLERYYSVSRARCRRWERCIDRARQELCHLPSAPHAALWNAYLPHFVDLLGAELLVRVWGALLTAADRATGQRHGSAVAHQVLQSQLRARQALLRLLVHELPLESALTAQLDRFRRLLERWTDLLTGHLVKRFALGQFACQLDRALEFGEEQLADLQGRQPATVWEMYLLCARARFPDQRLPGGIDGQLRDGQLRAVLSGLPAALFDEHGAPQSARLWHQLRVLSLPDREGARSHAIGPETRFTPRM